MPAFGKTSLKRLATCHPKLIQLCTAVVAEYDITILCGYRNENDQEDAYINGKSKAHYPNSRHNRITESGNQASSAVDVGPWIDNHVPWHDTGEFAHMATVFYKKAQELDIKIEWGGHFKWVFDGPHIQLAKEEYA